MLEVTSSRSIVGAVLSILVGAGMAVPAKAGIKDEYERAQECDYSKAEYGSDVDIKSNLIPSGLMTDISSNGELTYCEEYE